ncbi:caveolae-associated protein 4a-like [Stigmatopora nigra]
MTDGSDAAAGVTALLERVASLMESVQATQHRMEERQLGLENAAEDIRAGVLKLAGEQGAAAAGLDKLLEKTRKVGRHLKDVRVRLENQNLRVKKVEATQGDLLAKNKFRVVIYQGDREVPEATPAEGAEPGGAGAHQEPSEGAAPPSDSDDEEYMVVEEADAAAAATRGKKTGLTRMESLKAAFSRENLSKTRESLGTKVNRLGQRMVPEQRRQKIKETLAKGVPKKERTLAEGQEGGAPVPPPKGRRRPSDRESDVPVYDMRQLS